MKSFDLPLLLTAIILIIVITLSSCSSHRAPINKHTKSVQKHKRPACEKTTSIRITRGNYLF